MEGAIISDLENGDFNDKDEAVYLDDSSGITDDFKKNFTDARKAIEDGDMPMLQAAVQALQDMKEDAVNVVVKVPGPKRDPLKLLPMSLLAFAGYHARMDMIRFLIENHARIDEKNLSIGTPLLQMLNYARIRDSPNQIDIEVVRFFIDHKDTVLSRVLNTGYIRNSTALDACMFLGRFDIIKELLTSKECDLIKGGNPDMRPIFVEYVHYPFNKFLKWFFKEHITSDEIPEFVRRIFPVKKATKHTARKVYGKNPLHALLLCGNGEVVSALLTVQPNILEEVDPFGKTALHIAAERGDIDSVRILLDKGADLNCFDGFSMTPMMLATKNEHIKVVEMLMDKMECNDKNKNYGPENLGPMVMWAWALQNCYTTYFRAMHMEREREELLHMHLDRDENNIAHLAAESGNTVIFKAVIPKIQKPNVYEILLLPNKKQLTPLQVAIMKGNVRILQALQEQRAERKKLAEREYSIDSQGDSVEDKDLNTLWKDHSLNLMLFACEHGTVDVVKYFVTELVSPKFGTTGNRDRNPVYYAAMAGKHEIVEYLLSINEVSPDSETESLSPILAAARNGHAKCVIHLIDKGANLIVRSKSDFNYLMETIAAGHSDAARDIVTHLCSNDEKWKITMEAYDNKTKELTPMRMLIEHMPDVAKLAMTRCVQEQDVPPPQGVANLNTNQQKSFYYDFSLIEDFSEKGCVSSWRPCQYSSTSHPLAHMVKYNRLELLQHPLMTLYIARKWWKEAFPFFITYFFFYAVFLVFLTSFALRVPRPSPGDEFCPSNSSKNGFTHLDMKNGDCSGPIGSDKAAFPIIAVILILMSIGFFAFEIFFRYIMREHLTTFYYWFELVIRFGVFLFTIMFVSGFGHECWCTPPWQWQIGALAVFLAYFNAVLLLKGLPFLKIGIYISMLLKILATFMALIYLPVLLILAFAFPFYMLFVRDATSEEIEAFSTPAHSLVKIIVQSAGEFDFESLFNDGGLLYSPMAYILFISFVVLMPILFSNMLVGLAVRTADEDRKNAEFTNIQLQVQYILGLENFKIIRRRGYLNKEQCSESESWLWRKWDCLREIDYDSQKEKLCKDTDEKSREKVTKMSNAVGDIQERLPALERSHRELQQSMEHIAKLLQELGGKTTTQ